MGSEVDRVDDESLVGRFRLPEKDDLEDEVEIEEAEPQVLNSLYCHLPSQQDREIDSRRPPISTTCSSVFFHVLNTVLISWRCRVEDRVAHVQPVAGN